MQNLPFKSNPQVVSQDSERFFKISEAARILGLSSETIRRWDRLGKISVGRTSGGKRVFNQEDLENLRTSFRGKRTYSSSPSGKDSSLDLAKLIILILIIFLAAGNIFFFFKSPYSQTLNNKIVKLQVDLKNKVSDFLLSFLPPPSLLLSEVPGNLLINSDNSSQDSEDSTLSFSRGTLTPNAILRWDSTNDLFQFESFPLLLSSNLTVGGTISTSSIRANTAVFQDDIALVGETPSITIQDTETLTITDGTNTLLSLIDTGTQGDLSITGVYKVGDTKGLTKSACGSTQYLGGLGTTGGIVTSTGDCKDISLSTAGGWTDDGTVVRLTTATDLVGIGTTAPISQLQVNTQSTSTIGQIIKAVSSQTADLLQLRNSVDTILAKIDADGDLTARTLESTVSTGTAPLTVASTTVVPNLNASLLEGNSATTLASQPQPNLVLNSDFSRRNKWMTFMPETFTDTSGYQQIDAGTAPTVGTGGGVCGSNCVLTFGAANNQIGYPKVGAGTGWWRDIRASAQVKAVSTTGVFALRIRYVDNNNFVEVRTNGASPNRVELRKVIAGVSTVVTSVQPAAITLNNWYWLEIEAQGTTFIVKWYSSGASPVAKSSATLLETLSGTVSEGAVGGAVAVGGITITSDQSNAAWGGLATGDGGVYVEGWGPESWPVTFDGVIGGQAIGFDETADAGPAGKQWALRAYIPATNRRIYSVVNGPDGGAPPSVTWTHSVYVKTSGKTGTNALAEVEFGLFDSAVSTGDYTRLGDTGETVWTRKTGTYSGLSTDRRHRWIIQFNRLQTAAGTGFIMLPQTELGSVATPWRNAPADDGPIITSQNQQNPNNYTNSTSTATEVDPSRYAVNFFCPWDCTLEAAFNGFIDSGTVADEMAVDVSLDGSRMGNSELRMIQPVANSYIPFTFIRKISVAAGKHRLAARFRRVAGSGTARMTAQNTLEPYLLVTATRGKFDLAEEYEVSDNTIEAGDVVRLSQKLEGKSQNLIERTDKGYDQSILGIISTAPGITLSSTVELNSYQDKPNLRPVALSGRVPVKVTPENGPIKRGDILTSSNTKPGYAMLATRAGRSIGVAMEDLPEGVLEGKILTFVNLSFYDPQVYLTDTGNLSIVKNITSEPISLGEENGNTSSSSTNPIYQIQDTVTKEIIERIGAFNNLFVANLKVGSIDVDSINSEEIDELRIKNEELGISIASISGRLEFLENIGTESAILSSSVYTEGTRSASFSDLTIFNKLITTDLGVTGKISSGLLIIEGINPSTGSGSSINTLGGDLYLQSNLLGGINILGGKVTIDTKGNLKVQKISIDESEIDNKSIGAVIIKIGETQSEVTTTALTPNSYIFTTPDIPIAVGATKKNDTTILINLKEPAIQDVKINWWIVN